MAIDRILGEIQAVRAMITAAETEDFATNMRELLTQFNDRYIQPDTFTANHVLLMPEFGKLLGQLLGVYLRRSQEFDQDAEFLLVSFVKCLTIKSNFRHIKKTLKVILGSFKDQILAGEQSRPIHGPLNLLGSIIGTTVSMATDRYFFMATSKAECLKVDLFKVRCLKENIKALSVFVCFQADFQPDEEERRLVSKIAITESLYFSIVIANSKMVLKIFKKDNLIKEHILYPNLQDIAKKTLNFFSFSLQNSAKQLHLSTFFNGQVSHTVFPAEYSEPLNPIRMRLELFGDMLVGLHYLGLTRQFLEQSTSEKIRTLILNSNVKPGDIARRFREDFAAFEFALVSAKTILKPRNGNFAFRDYRLDNGVTFTGYLSEIECSNNFLNTILIAQDVIGKLLVSSAFFQEKETILKLAISLCKNISLLRVGALCAHRDYIAELKSCLVSIGFGPNMTPSVTILLPTLIKNDSNPFLDQILNKFVLSFEVLEQLTTPVVVAEFFQHLFITFERNEQLLALINFQKLLMTAVSVFEVSQEQTNASKLAKLTKVIEMICSHGQAPDKLDINPLIAVLFGIDFPQTDSHKVFYRLIFKLIRKSKANSKKREMLNPCVSNFLYHTSDAHLIRKVLGLLMKINRGNPAPFLLAWRTKMVSKNSLTNVLETYHTFSQRIHRFQDCEKLWEKIKSYLYAKESLDSNSGEFGKWADERYNSLVLEMTFGLDSHSLELLLLSLNLSFEHFPNDFITKMSPNLFLLWAFSLLQKTISLNEEKAINELTTQLLTRYMSEVVTRRKSVRSLRTFFFVAGWYAESKKRCNEISTIVASVFKHLNDKGLKIDRENDFSGFVVLLFVYFDQTFHLKEKTNKTAAEWSPILAFLGCNLNNQIKKGLISELGKPVSKVLSSNPIKEIFFRQGIDPRNNNEKTSVLSAIFLMVFQISSGLLEQHNVDLDACVVSSLSSTFTTLYAIIDKERSNLPVEQLLEIERVLVRLLRFVSAHPTVHAALDPIVACLGSIKPKPEGFLCKFWGQESAMQMDLARLRSWVETLIFEEQCMMILKEQGEIQEKADIQNCLMECQNGLIEENLVTPKFDEELEAFVSKNHSKILEVQIAQKLQRQEAMDALKLENTCVQHSLRHSFKKMLKKARQQNMFLFPKVLNDSVYRTGSVSISRFESELNDKLLFKHRGIVTRELQRPFVKILAKESLRLPPEPVALPVNSAYDRFIQHHKLCAYPVIWVKKFCFLGGYLYTDQAGITMSFLLNQKLIPKRKNPIELVEYQHRTDRRMLFTWRVQDVSAVHEYKFFQKRNALEFFFANSHTEIFQFEDKTSADAFFRVILRTTSQKVPRSADPLQLFGNKEYQKKWEQEYISNFRYLMLVNMHASRSFADYSQYPVFPVLMKQIDQSGVLARDLEKPIGITGDEKRREAFIQRLTHFPAFNKGRGYNFGSHYSSPAIVLSYLIRLRPYERGCLAIQNGTFDLPDRLFFSIKSTLRNVMSDISDVREFVPELFYLPAVYFNLNQFPFGKNQNSVVVHDVIVPEPFRGNIFKMIFWLRRQLESEATSSKLGKWIDLIFGALQRGERAKKNNNVFYHLTYEGGADPEDLKDPQALEATENQIYHFGQVPFQLFNSHHPCKSDFGTKKNLANSWGKSTFREIVNSKAHGRPEPSYLIKKITSHDLEAGLFIFHVKRTYVAVYRHIDSFSFNFDNKRYVVQFEEQLSIAKIKSTYFNVDEVDFRADGVVDIIGGFRIVFGGFVNGKVMVFNMRNQKKLVEYSVHVCPVLKLMCPRKDRLITSDASGVLVVSAIDVSTSEIMPLHTIFDFFFHQIPVITACTSDSDFYCFYSTKGEFQVRSMWQSDKVLFSLPYSVPFGDRRASPSRIKYTHCLLSFGYINSLVVCGIVDDRSEICTYSFEGLRIAQRRSTDKQHRIVYMTTIKDEFFCDYLLFVNERCDTFLVDLPLLECETKASGSGEFRPKFFSPLSTGKSLLMLNNEGTIRIFSV